MKPKHAFKRKIAKPKPAPKRTKIHPAVKQVRNITDDIVHVSAETLYNTITSRAGLSTFEALGKSNLSGPHNHHIVASQHAHTVLYCVCKQHGHLTIPTVCMHTAVILYYRYSIYIIYYNVIQNCCGLQNPGAPLALGP